MSAEPGKNPYRPGASTPPLFLAGRDPQLNRFPKILRAAPEIPASLRLTGLRGVGKTVLLKEYQRQAEEAGWAVIRHQLEPRHNHEEALATLIANVVRATSDRLSRAARIRAGLKSAAEVARKVVTVRYQDVVFAAGGTLSADLDVSRSLFDGVQAALDAGHVGLALLLDESQVIRDDRDRGGEHPLSMLVAAVNALQEAGLPLAFVVCGLPTLRSNLQRARTYSERMFRGEVIGALAGNPGPARDAFLKPLQGTQISADERLINRVLNEVEGYPFFIQLWGAELWDAASDSGAGVLTTAILDAVESDLYARLDEEFYAGRVETLTPGEQDLLVATAGCSYPPLRTAEIRSVSSKSEGNINVLMGRLTEQGVIYRVQKGVYEYTAPKFHDYLQRRARTQLPE